MKLPYTYSMPESFLKDKSVPARWRVLGVINGFILNGGCFFGSNKYLMEQLSCSEQTVSNAFEELEMLHEIRVERTRRTRKVYKTSRDPSYLGSETQTEDARDPSSFGTNSVSNSVRDTAEAGKTSLSYEIVPIPRESDSDGDLGDSKSPRVKGDKRKAYDELIRWSENERGFPFPKTTITKQYRAFKIANENSFSRESLMDKWSEMAADKFWQDKGFDWMNVVQQLEKKPV